jgi:protein-S-isoprenylcysteine O-methyltransferase Ste14
MVSMRVGTILTWMWVAFGVYWLASALTTKKSATHEPGPWRVLRLSILTVTFILLLTNWLWIGPLGWRFVPDNVGIRSVGVAATVAGLVLCVWARMHLGANWSDKVVLKVDHQLVQSGPYAYLRHPIYSGVLLAIAGTATAVGEWRGLLALVLMGTNYFVKARREERILSSRFGEEFDAYRRQAGFLVPKF